MMEPLTHSPDFTQATEDEKAQGWSSRCTRCRRLLPAGMELIASRCPGQAD